MIRIMTRTRIMFLIFFSFYRRTKSITEESLVSLRFLDVFS